MKNQECEFKFKVTHLKKTSQMTLIGDEFLFGRNPECSFFIDDNLASRVHFKIIFINDRLWVTDDGSTNGTFLNGVKLKKSQASALIEGDSLLVGKSEFSISIISFKSTAVAINKSAESSSKDTVLTEKIQQNVIPRIIPSPINDAQIASKKMYEEAMQLAKQAREQASIDADGMISSASLKINAMYSEAESQIELLRQSSKKRLEEELSAHKEYSLSEMKENIQFEKDRLLKDSKMAAESTISAAKSSAEKLLSDSDKKASEIMQLASLQCEELRRKQRGLEKQLEESEKNTLAAKESLAQIQNTLVEAQNEVSARKLQANKLGKEVSDLDQEKLELRSIIANLEKKSTEAKISLDKNTDEYKLKLLELENNWIIKKSDLDISLEKHHAVEKKKLSDLLKLETEQLNLKVLSLNEEVLNHTKQISLSITSEISKFLVGKIDLEMLKEIELNISPVIANQIELYATKRIGSAQNLKATKKSNFLTSFAWGAASTAALFGLVAFVYYRVDLKSNPVHRAIASEMKEHSDDLLSRKFNPGKTTVVYASLADSVIYTKGYLEAYQDDQFYSNLVKSANKYFLKTYQIPEENTVAAMSNLRATISRIFEMKENIHPDYIDSSLVKINQFEHAQLIKLNAVLGNEVRVKALLGFQKEYLEKYLAK